MEPAGQNSAHGVAMETQAIGRSVRLGQVRRVTVTRFVIEGTIEEKIHHLNMETRKQRGNSILQPSDINTITAQVSVHCSSTDNVHFMMKESCCLTTVICSQRKHQYFRNF
jgi:hypothetical protein